MAGGSPASRVRGNLKSETAAQRECGRNRADQFAAIPPMSARPRDTMRSLIKARIGKLKVEFLWSWMILDRITK